jgi:hypothetical protein
MVPAFSESKIEAHASVTVWPVIGTVFGSVICRIRIVCVVRIVIAGIVAVIPDPRIAVIAHSRVNGITIVTTLTAMLIPSQMPAIVMPPSPSSLCTGRRYRQAQTKNDRDQ